MKGYWIGLTDRDLEGNWKWESGDSLNCDNWEHWKYGEPNNAANGKGEEDCAELINGKEVSDIDCQSHRLAFCVKKRTDSCVKKDGKDEMTFHCKARCQGSFTCKDNGRCIPNKEKCNGVNGCSDGSDENAEMCNVYCADADEVFACNNNQCKESAYTEFKFKCGIVGSWKVYTSLEKGNYKAALPKCRKVGADLVGKDTVDEVR